MKKIVLLIFTILLIVIMPIVSAHSGRTDSNGGHKDNKNKSGLGPYHYHCGGNPPHLHSNGICPYAGSTDSSSGYASSSSSVPKTVQASSVSISEKPNRDLSVGEEFILKASVYPENADDKKIEWESSDPAIATVDAVGKISAIGAGTVTITAKTSNGKTSSFSVTINEVIAEKLTISNKPEALVVKESIALKTVLVPDNTTDKSIAWVSSDPKIATVDNNGTVKAISKGKVTISAKQKDVEDSFILSVLPIEVDSISITTSIEDNKMKVGDSIPLSASVYPKDAEDKTITWSVNDETKASIENGCLVAKEPGDITVKAQTNNGKISTIDVKIYSNAVPITVCSILFLGGGGGLGYYIWLQKRRRHVEEVVENE